MKQVNYELADASLHFCYDNAILTQMLGGESDVLAHLAQIVADIKINLGMACDVCDEETEHTEKGGVYVLHMHVQQRKKDPGEDKEYYRLDFLRCLAETVAEIEVDPELQVFGFKMQVQVAEHNQAEFGLYLTECREALKKSEKVVCSIENDARIAVMVDIAEVEHLQGAQIATDFCEQMAQCVQNYADTLFKDWGEATLDSYQQDDLLAIEIAVDGLLEQKMFALQLKCVVDHIREEMGGSEYVWVELDVNPKLQAAFAAVILPEREYNSGYSTGTTPVLN